MKKFRKKTIIIVLLITFAVGYIVFLQTQRHPHRLDDKVMLVAACGSNDEIFIIGNTFDEQSGDLLTSGIYTLDKDKNKISLYNNMALVDSVSFKKIALDKDNGLFAIVQKQDEIATYEIWEINNGIVLNKYDITNSIDEKNSGGIHAFTIDGHGNFFIREIVSDEIIVIDKSGFETSRLKDIASNISFESMATGKDGQVYALFCKNVDTGSGYKIISFADGLINEICDGNILPTEEVYSVMGTSTKYDLVMKGIFGVYGYNFNSEAAESITYFPTYEAEFTKSFIAEDKLYIFFTDVEDDKRYKIKSIELKSIDLLTGIFR